MVLSFKRLLLIKNKDMLMLGSGCGSVGRAVASDTRDPWFESRHRQNFIYQSYNRKDEKKAKFNNELDNRKDEKK